jgi:hypothetical protein
LFAAFSELFHNFHRKAHLGVSWRQSCGSSECNELTLRVWIPRSIQILTLRVSNHLHPLDQFLNRFLFNQIQLWNISRPLCEASRDFFKRLLIAHCSLRRIYSTLSVRSHFSMAVTVLSLNNDPQSVNGIQYWFQTNSVSGFGFACSPKLCCWSFRIRMRWWNRY